MATSGSGTMTAVSSGVPTTTIAAPRTESCVTLKRYAEIIGYPQCNFFGINADIETGFQCKEIWTKDSRDMVSRSLREAQDEIEQTTGYPLCARWIGENESQLYRDQQPYKRVLITRFAHIIESGIKTTSTIQAGSVIDHSSDPAVVGPIATDATNTDEIHIFYPDSDRVVYTYSIEISAGLLTIWIERCHLVAPDKLDNPSTGLAYDDPSNFLATVDVKWIRNSTTTEATLVSPQCTRCNCNETTRAGCIYIDDYRVGVIEVKPTNGTCSGICCCRPRLVRLNYRAGLETLTQQAEDTIVRLAHSKMPNEPCGCDVMKRLWGRDTNVPEVLTAERLNCPYGLSDGAWIAFQFAQSMKVYRSSNL